MGTSIPTLLNERERGRGKEGEREEAQRGWAGVPGASLGRTRLPQPSPCSAACVLPRVLSHLLLRSPEAELPRRSEQSSFGECFCVLKSIFLLTSAMKSELCSHWGQKCKYKKTANSGQGRLSRPATPSALCLWDRIRTQHVGRVVTSVIQVNTPKSEK